MTIEKKCENLEFYCFTNKVLAQNGYAFSATSVCFSVSSEITTNKPFLLHRQENYKTRHIQLALLFKTQQPKVTQNLFYFQKKKMKKNNVERAHQGETSVNKDLIGLNLKASANFKSLFECGQCFSCSYNLSIDVIHLTFLQFFIVCK